ncbi:hypothetical protein ACFQAT_21035 [Undibacterium arcticum]|uniref:Uncharacterized protein n=1 Tax=Undibacterium arcticum TaxID=1762892 RepID=A0ABV7EWN2_9BURK
MTGPPGGNSAALQPEPYSGHNRMENNMACWNGNQRISIGLAAR